MAAPRRTRQSTRTVVVWSALQAALAARYQPGGLAVLDAGGGSGGFAVPMAELGHRVTVVDPSPDSLAALDRRAAEAGVTTVRGLQGSLDDVAGMLAIAGRDSFDVVLAHHVLEVVDDPATAVDAIAQVLRPGGLVSVLAANRVGAVFGRVLAGRLDEAARLVDDPAGRYGAGDVLARRFEQAALLALLETAGLRVDVVHAARVFTDLLPESLLESDPDALDTLVRLETAVAGQPAYCGAAAALHVLAVRR